MKASLPKEKSNEDWVVVAEFMLDIDADMAVSLLQGNDIPAVRFPVKAYVASYWAFMEPIRVLVPPDREEAAQELLR